MRIERPERHYTLLRAANGDYLGTEDGESLATYGIADDAVIWERVENSQRYRHVVTALHVEIETITATRRCRVRCNAAPVTLGDGQFAIDRGPSELPSASLRFFRANGWVCLAAILDPDTLAALEDVALAGRWSRADEDPHSTPLNKSAAVAKVAAEPVSLWLSRQYLQSNDIRFGHSPSLVVLYRDDGRCDVQGWHADFPYLWGSPRALGGDRVPSGRSGQLVLGVQRNVCISEFTKANGATCFKLGTHVLDTGPPSEWGVDADYAQPGHRQRHGLPYQGPETDVIEAPAGSIILYDARTWHRAGVNRTERPRAAMLQALTPMFVLPFKDTSEPYRQLLDSSLIEELTERERSEIERLMVHTIVGPLGRHAITVDPSLTVRINKPTT